MRSYKDCPDDKKDDVIDALTKQIQELHNVVGLLRKGALAMLEYTGQVLNQMGDSRCGD